jgi:RNA polymerase sigma-70 factor (ECF subfamily)
MATGHIADFEALVLEHQDKVFRLCYSMLGDRAQAEDAAQEAFLRIWKSLDKFRGESSASTWIFAVTRNVCLTAIARRNARNFAPMEEADRVQRDQPQPDFDIAKLVAQLPGNFRQVVMLFYMEERSYEEVARMLDMPVGTVKTHLHRARKQLAMMLEETHARRA